VSPYLKNYESGVKVNGQKIDGLEMLTKLFSEIDVAPIFMLAAMPAPIPVMG
jgi:hypothetical protein